ncbi:MAG: hypothetical protein ACI81P_001286 [Neolewinella sp.]|jgi:hypothetical protein
MGEEKYRQAGEVLINILPGIIVYHLNRKLSKYQIPVALLLLPLLNADGLKY